MKAHLIRTAGFLVVLSGCSAGAIGQGVDLSSSGSGGMQALPPGDYVDGGYVITPDGAVAANMFMSPASGASSGSLASSGASSGVAQSSSGASGGTTTSGSTSAAGSPVIAQQSWRLSNVEYVNTVTDLLGIAPTEPLDPDAPSGGFRVGGAAGDPAASAYHASAVALSAAAVANMTQLLQPAGCTAAGGATCAASFINEFALRAFRRPVDASVTAGLNQVYATVAASGGFAAGIQAVLQDVLQSPYLLYHLELEEQAQGPGLVPVTNYSMASRLSYLLWASMPDATLFSAAAAKQLATPAQVQAQASRMLADPKARTGLRNFYEQWMNVQYTIPLAKGGTSTQILPGGALSPSPLTTTGQDFSVIWTPALQAAVLQSFDAQIDAALWSGMGGMNPSFMKTLLTGTTVYANAILAPLFGVSGVTGNALVPVQVDSTKRAGILTHPALMSVFATTNVSHPIKRGRFIWDQIICQALPDPPPNAPSFTPPPPGQSQRVNFEDLTATGPYAGQMRVGTDGQPLACPACHTRINPVGFLYEPFDTIGDFRTIDDFGQPVDLTHITIVGAADPAINIVTPNAMTFGANLAGSDLPNSCLMTQLYRYMAKRQEAAADVLAINGLDTAFTQGGQSLMPVLLGLTQTDVFLNRLNVQ